MSILRCEICHNIIIWPSDHDQLCMCHLIGADDRCTCPDDRGEPGLHHLDCCPLCYETQEEPDE